MIESRPGEMQAGRTRSPRLAGLDVTRAVALAGVVVMNYHGYLNGGDDGIERSFAERVFDPAAGPLTTRFAAVFVVVAGMGITLLTNRSRRSGIPEAIREDRWRLARRGLLLYAFGLVIEWIWNGTILFYYGAFFLTGSLLFTLALRWLVAVGAAAALGAAAIAWFRINRELQGRSTDWLEPPLTSPRNLVLRTFVGYTHPLLPWLAFVCAGIVLGRLLPMVARTRIATLAAGLAMFAGSYAVNFAGLRWGPARAGTAGELRWRRLLSTAPFDRGLLYTIGTLGSSLVAFCVISWLAERRADATLTGLFRHAGQMTLTIYVAHVLFFNAVVRSFGLVGPTGLDSAIVLALIFLVFAIVLGALWHRYVGAGPLERIYRDFGG